MEKHETKALKSIQRVIQYLNSDWIVESCGDYAAKMGCASCYAMDLKTHLKTLAIEILENDGQDPYFVAKW